MGERMIRRPVSGKGALCKRTEKEKTDHGYIKWHFDTGIAEQWGML